MTADQRETESLYTYYEPISGFKDIRDKQADFSCNVADIIIKLGPEDTTVVVPLIGGMYQWWRLEDVAPGLVKVLRPNVVFMAKDPSGAVHFRGQPMLRHVFKLDDIGDELSELGRLLASDEVTNSKHIETVHFSAPVQKTHTQALMEELNQHRPALGLPLVDFYIPHVLPNDVNGEPIWVCSGFGMNEGPDPAKLSGGNLPGSLTSLAAYQRMVNICLKRREGVVPNYAMEIQYLALLLRSEANHPDQTRRVNKLIDLETYKGNWQRQFNMVDRWIGE
ncbi:MAG: hypothetical protein NUV65_02675 [Candidatus Roizmanbacteria bacterium]|nr:hypothetical protein [Candidatus Roizmanbacteria bacterium]